MDAPLSERRQIKMKSLQEIEGAAAGGGAGLRHVERWDSLLFKMRSEANLIFLSCHMAKANRKERSEL